MGPSFQGGVITNLALLGGTLAGDNIVSGSFYTAANLPGSLTLLSGASVNWAGGSIQGPVNIAAGASLTLSSNTTKYLWGALTNAGTVTWTGTGNLEVDYASANNQFGLIQNLAGGLWDIQNSTRVYNSAPNEAYFQNAGTVQKSADPGTTTISIPFYNAGSVAALQGTLLFNGGGFIGSAFSAASGATINFNAGAFTYNRPPAITGAGTVEPHRREPHAGQRRHTQPATGRGDHQFGPEFPGWRHHQPGSAGRRPGRKQHRQRQLLHGGKVAREPDPVERGGGELGGRLDSGAGEHSRWRIADPEQQHHEVPYGAP